MIKKRLLTGDALKARAEALGIDPFEIRLNARLQKREEDIQREIREHERAVREARLWIFALVSAIASVGSAIAAILAVVLTSG